MTPSETAELLGTIQAFDRRTVGEADIMAWHVTLADVELADARAAVLEHFGQSKDWLMPSDIKTIIAKTRSRRIGAVPPVVPPWQLADRPTDEIRWESEYRHGIADGLPQETAVAKANYMLGVEDTGPLAIEPPAGMLRDRLDRGARELADKKRMAEIEAEVARQAKVARRSRQEADEAAREPRDPNIIIAEHLKEKTA